MEYLTLLFIAFVYGSWAFVFMRLQEPGEIFDFVPGVMTFIISLGYAKSAKVQWDRTWLENAFCKWTFECAKCHAGFISLMFFPAWALPVTAFNYLAFITLSILTAIILTENL